MDQPTSTALEKAAAYVEQTAPKLEKLAALEQERVDFNAYLQKTAAVLENRGLIRSEKVNDFLNKAAEDPRAVLQYMERLAKTIGNDGLGSVTSVTKAAADTSSMDPFEVAFFGDDKQ